MFNTDIGATVCILDFVHNDFIVGVVFRRYADFSIIETTGENRQYITVPNNEIIPVV